MSLEHIKENLESLKAELTYVGYNPQKPSDSEAIIILCQTVIQLIEYIEKRDNPPGMTKEDYEAIYGWGGQG